MTIDPRELRLARCIWVARASRTVVFESVRAASHVGSDAVEAPVTRFQRKVIQCDAKGSALAPRNGAQEAMAAANVVTIEAYVASASGNRGFILALSG